MRHHLQPVLGIIVGAVTLVAGIYMMIHPAGAAEAPMVKQSVMQPYVATPQDIARARELTHEYYAQPVPKAPKHPTQQTWSQPSLVRPSAWPTIKHDDPRSLGNGYVMQMVYPRQGVSCSVIRNEQTGAVVSHDCNSIPGK